MVNTSDSPSEEIINMAKTIGTLEAAVGSIQTELSEVTSSFNSKFSKLRDIIKIMMAKP